MTVGLSTVVLKRKHTQKNIPVQEPMAEFSKNEEKDL